MEFHYNDGGRKAAGFRGKCEDCVVRAIAIATKLPYREVYEELQDDMDWHRDFGRKSTLRGQLRTDKAFRRGSVRHGVYKRIFKDYLAALGWQWVPTMQIGSGCRVHLREGELPRGRLIVSVSKHLVAVIDGVIHDTDDPSRDGSRCVYGYWIAPSDSEAHTQG